MVLQSKACAAAASAAEEDGLGEGRRLMSSSCREAGEEVPAGGLVQGDDAEREVSSSSVPGESGAEEEDDWMVSSGI